MDSNRIGNVLSCIYADNYLVIDFLRNFNKKALILYYGIGFCLFPLFLILLPIWSTVAAIFCTLYTLRLLVASAPEYPKLYGDEEFKRNCLIACTTLNQKYIPTILWGRSGIMQTIMLSTTGRLSWTMPNWERRTFVAHDNTTMYYDILEPSEKDNMNLTLILCPGYTCFSHLNYIRHFCLRAQKMGIRCVVINQPAFTPDLKLTSARLYTFNETEFLEPIVSIITKEHPFSNIVLMGQSYGTAITTKFAGQVEKLPTSVVGLITVGSISSVARGKSLKANFSSKLFAWLGKYYIFKNKEVTLSDYIKKKYGIDEEKLRAATENFEVVEEYNRKMRGFSSIEEYLQECNVTETIRKVAVPYVVIQAEDDPLLPRTIKEYKPILENREESLLVTTKHGGHLAYHTGGFILPSKEPWIDDAVLEIAQFLSKKAGPRKYD